MCTYICRHASIFFGGIYMCVYTHKHTYLHAFLHLNIIFWHWGDTYFWFCLVLWSLASFLACFWCPSLVWSHLPLHQHLCRCKRGGFVWQWKERGGMLSSFAEKLQKAACFQQLCIPPDSPSFLPLPWGGLSQQLLFLILYVKNLSIYFLRLWAERIFILSRKNNNHVTLGSQTIGLNTFKDHFIILFTSPWRESDY